MSRCVCVCVFVCLFVGWGPGGRVDVQLQGTSERPDMALVSLFFAFFGIA